jgi:multiple sugar transport system substrate-binding protein
MKRLVFVALLALCAGLLFAGGSQGETAMAEKIELRYMMWDPQIIEKEQALAQKFHELNPNVSITVEGIAYAQFWEKIQAMAAAKTLPDVFWMAVDRVKDNQRMGALLDLQPYVDKLDKSNYFESVFNVLRAPNANGDMYAFPYAWVVCIFYYNMRLFDEAGLQYPPEKWTWDEMRNLAIKLTKDIDGDGNADQWGYWVKGRYTHTWSYVYNNGAQMVSDDFKRCLLDEGKGKEAMKFLADLVIKDKVSPTPAQTKGVSTFFTTGKIAMCTEGSWRIDTYRKSLADPFGITYLPLGPGSGGKYDSFGWPDSYAISAYTKHPDESWAWTEYMAGPGRPVDSVLGGKVSIWKKSALSDAWAEKNMLPENKDLVLKAGALIGKNVTFAPGWPEWSDQIAASDFDKILLGEGDFDTVMAEMTEKIDKVLARY